MPTKLRMDHSDTVSEINRKRYFGRNLQIFHTPVHLTLTMSGFPWNSETAVGLKKTRVMPLPELKTEKV